MNCALTPKQQKDLLIKVYKDLQRMSQEPGDFSVESYVKDFYNTIADKTGDKALALSYAQLLPDFINLAFTGRKDLVRSLRDKGLSRDALEDMIDDFEEINNVQKIVEPVVDAQTVEDNLQAAAADLSAPVAPKPTTPKETAKQTKENSSFKAKVNTPLATIDQEAIEGTNRRNPDKAFKFGFIRELNKVLSEQTEDPTEAVIGNHKGFRLKAVKASKINTDSEDFINALDTNDQMIFKNPDARGIKNPKAFFGGNTVVVVSDNDGNFLYFDENYNVVEPGSRGSKLVYFSMRKRDAQGTITSLQPVEELAASLFTPTEEISSFNQLREQEPRMAEALIERAKQIRDTQESTYDAIREYVQNVPQDGVLLDITETTKGYLAIEFGAATDIDSIDWNNSDIEFNAHPADIKNDERGETAGQLYIRVEGNKSIPIQRNDLSSQDVDSIVSLLFDPVKIRKRNKLQDVSKQKRKQLVNSYTLENSEGIQIFTDNTGDLPKVRLEGKNLETGTPEELQESRDKVREFLTRKAKDADGNDLDYNIRQAQYAFTYPKSGNQVEEFVVANNELTVTPVDFNEHVRSNSKLMIVPNEEDRIILLNGHMKFKPTLEERQKLGLSTQEAAVDVQAEDKLKPKALRANESFDTTAPAEKVKEAKKSDTKGKGRLSGGKPLYAARVIESKATPKQLEAAKNWWNTSPLAEYVDFNEMFNVVNSDAWAEFTGSAINLYAGADYSLLYHEAWHAFSELFLTPEQQKALYKEVENTAAGRRATKGIKNELNKHLALEELLAEDFRKYQLSGGEKVLGERPVRNNIFKKIFEFLKRLFRGYKAANQTGTSIKMVEEMYQALSVGKINQVPRQANRLFTSPLYSRIEGSAENPSTLTDQDSIMIVESIDSVIADIVDEENAANGNMMFTSALFTAPEVYLGPVLEEVKSKLIDKRDELAQGLNELDNLSKEHMEHKIAILDEAVKQWDSEGGTVEYFLNKSPLLGAQTKTIDKEAFEKTRDDVNATRFDKAGNDLSMKDLSSNRILYLVKSLRDYDGKEPLYNELGFRKLVNPGLTWRNLINTLMDSNESPREMYQAMVEAAPNSPWITDLLNKLGPVDTEFASTFDTWTEFWSAFNMASWGLYQVSVNEYEGIDQQTGEQLGKEFEILVGYASAVFRKVERDFKSHFKAVKGHPFIKDTAQFGNKLDYAVLDKYKGKLTTPVNKINFLNDIGLPVANTSDIAERIGEVRVDFIFNKLEKLSAKNVPIYDIIQELNSDAHFVSELTNVNKILNLQARYSGQYANTAVSTADGNDKYEETQMSSLAVIQRSVNKAKNFQELISQPHMSYLHPDNNPAVKAGAVIWLRSLFKYNPTTKTYGERIGDVTFEIDNLSGTQSQIDKSYADYDYSTSTASADKYTKLLQDMYSGIMGGRFATMVPADKSTTLSMRVTNINSGAESTTKHLYVDMSSFLGKGAATHLAEKQAFELLLPHLEAELIRIDRITNNEVPRIPGYTVEHKGKHRGVEFAVFDDIFSPATLDKIKKAGSIDNISMELEEQMLDEFIDYVRWTTDNSKAAIDRMMFIDKNMQDLLDKEAGYKVPVGEAETAVLKAHAVNSLIHHIESLAMVYGDLAQYKDFPKRNPGIQSTGRVFRTDQEAINHINNVVGRPWAKRMGIKEHEFSTVVNTAILEENTIPSVMVQDERGIEFSQYGEPVYNDFLSRGMSKEEALEMTKQTLDAYNKMDEGDAQGWITFDAYRIFAKLEGRWTKKQEMLFQDIVRDPDNINIKDVLEFFPPRKYQYFGPLAVQGIVATAFHKYSLFPMIPTSIAGKNMEVLHNNMMEQGIDYAVFDSGSKVSTIVADGRFEGDQVYADKKARTMLETPEFTKNPIYLHYLKDQLDVAPKFKGKVIFSTQLRKLIEEGMVEGGVPVDYLPEEKDLEVRALKWSKVKNKEKTSPMYKRYKTYENKLEKFIEFRKAQLRDEVGWDGKGFSEESDLTKLVDFIAKQLDTQDIAEHNIDFIKVDKNGKLVHDLSVSLTAPVIERALTAIVNNRLVRQKVNGEALVQLATTMMEPRAATAEELEAAGGSNDLRTYRKDPETGDTLPMDVKVSLQGDFKHLLHMTHKDGKKIGVYTNREWENAKGETIILKELNQKESLRRLNETIQDPEWRKDNTDMITMIGVRIPVQGLNSMEYMAVWEFLPEETGNVIIPPSEMVAKSGSDFDIDKLTVMMPNIAMIGSAPTVIQEIENGKTNPENVDRINNINTELKELRSERSAIQKEAREAYGEIPTKDLTAEEVIEVKALNDEYYPRLNELDKQIRDLEFNIERLYGYKTLTPNQEVLLVDSEDALELLDNERADLDEEFIARKKEFGEAKNLKRSKAFDKAKAKSTESERLKDKIAELEREKLGLGDKAIENSMLFSMRDILKMPENFISLITPNSTSFFQGERSGGRESITDELSKNRDYDEKNTFKGKSRLSPTRVLEPSFNVNLHERNAVGKETLGQGAVDNTYNTVFNRVGVRMNPVWETPRGDERRATILMDHHKYGEGISLSHMYGKDGTKIADIINQLMNGWVDVAKDAWIFDIQGNKQVTPALLFLIQAGVPYESAIYFVSNPLVREYVKEQKLATSAFAKATGNAAEDITFSRNYAKGKILSKMGMFDVFSMSGNVKPKKLYNRTVNMTKDLNFTDIARQIAKYTPEIAYNDYKAKAAFLHYLEIEELAKGVRDIKMKLSYDTSRSTSLFEAQKAEADLIQMSADSKFPVEVVEGILNESPVGGFRVAPFQMELWGPLFKLRNHDTINNYLVNRLSSIDQVRKMKELFGTEEKWIEEFKNDFIVKMFTDAVREYNPNDEFYKGIEIEKTSQEQVDFLPTGVAIKDNKIYIDPYILDLQYKHKFFTGDTKKGSPLFERLTKDITYQAHGLAPVNAAAFTGMNGKDEYYRFVIEREYLRSTKPFEQLSKTEYFKYRFQANLQSIPRAEGETTERHLARITRMTYEMLLRDEALTNTMNNWHIFQSPNSIASQFFEIRDMHPELAKKYNIVNDLIMSSGGKVDADSGRIAKDQRYSNLALRDTRVDADMIDAYYQNMLELSSEDVISISESKYENAEVMYEENKRVAEFFERLPLVAFMQSGLNSTDSLSMVKAMPMDRIVNILESITPKYLKMLETPESLLFLSNFAAEFNAQNSRSNISIRRRVKKYMPFKYNEYATYQLSSQTENAKHHFNFEFEDSEISPMRPEFRGQNVFDLAVEGKVTALSYSPTLTDQEIKEGDIIELTKNFYKQIGNRREVYTRTLQVRATQDAYPVSMESQDSWSKKEGLDKSMYKTAKANGYNQVMFEVIPVDDTIQVPDNQINPGNEKQLEGLIKNNPNTIFVLEGALSGEGSYVSGIGKVKSFDNVFNIITRNELGSSPAALWDRTTTEDNKKMIDESLDKLEEMIETGDKTVVFLSSEQGYGTYMTNKITPDSKEMIDIETFDYLTTELYKRFGYTNRFAKSVADVQKIMTQNQDIDYKIDVPEDEIYDAMNRLTCKL